MRVILTVVNALALIGATTDTHSVAPTMEFISPEDLKKSVSEAKNDAVAKYKKVLADAAVSPGTKKSLEDIEKILKSVDKLQTSSKKNAFMKETESLSKAMIAVTANVPLMGYTPVEGQDLNNFRGRVRAFIMNGALLVAHSENSAKKLKEAAKSAANMVKIATDGGFIEELRKANPGYTADLEEFEVASRIIIEQLEMRFRGLRNEYENFLSESYLLVWGIKKAIKTVEAQLNAEKDEGAKKGLTKKLADLKEMLNEIPKLLSQGPDSVSKYYKSTVKKYRKAIPEGSLTKNVNAALGVKQGKKNLPLIIGLSVAGVLIVGAAVYFFVLRKH